MKGLGQIGSLKQQPPDDVPIFQSIFGDSWGSLPPVMQQHYANRPYSDDVTTVEGVMDVTMSPLAKLCSPLLRLTKTLIPKEGKDIAVTVRFLSEPNSDHFIFDREFRFPDGTVHHFHSRMEPIGGNEVVEWTGSGIGWHAAYAYEDGKVLLKHLGYCIRLLGQRIRLPLGLFFGYGDAYEVPTSDTSFDMAMTIRHTLLGNIYGYGGAFTIEVPGRTA